MDFPVNTSTQLKAVLRSLRRSRSMTQAALGTRLGVNQKRVARIERAPGVTSFDQIARLVSVLGGRIVIQTADEDTALTGRKASPAKGNW
jgi:HTH-type transcriptional regulator / antitoxin HipB